jgi:chromosome partitioning protein
MSPDGSQAKKGSGLARSRPATLGDRVARAASAAVSGDRGLVRDGKGKEPEHDWRVIDTPAGLHGEDLREAVRRADVMLVPLTPSAFDMGATRHFLTAIQEYKAIKKGELALGIVAMRVDPRTHSAAELDSFLQAFDFPVVTHLRDTQVYVHCARDGASVFDLPRSRGEQDWEQWKPLTRWITKHTTSKG